MNLILIGPAGSGKSTQADKLASELNIHHLNIGDLLYYASLGENNQALLIREAMEKGELVDSALVSRLVDAYLSEPEHQNGIIMDGHPRTLEEAKTLNLPIDKVINISLPDDVAKERLEGRGRFDDKPEAIEKRLEIYHKETQPILDYYKSQGLLEEVDGKGSVEDIAADIASRIQK